MSNFKTDSAYFSQLQTSTTCFCTIVLHRNKLVKQNQTCLSYLQCIAGMPLRKFRFILCFQFDGNVSHLIAMASLYFTKPHGEDEA